MVFKKIDVEQMKTADKKAFSCLFGRLANVAEDQSIEVPVMATSDGKNILTAEQIGRIFFALNKSFNFTLELSEIEKTSKDAEKFIIFNIKKVKAKNTIKTIEPEKTDLKRESSAKTSAKAQEKKASAKKEAEALNKNVKAKIISEIEKIACNYGKFETKNLSLFIVEIQKILDNNF